jgi:hypothetical protein
MRTIIFLLSIFLLSCNQSAISKKLSTSDSVVVTFNELNSDAVSKTVAATEKTAISKLSGFLSGKVTEQYKCGYDGNMIFYSQGKELMPVVFKYKDKNCRFFLYELDGKTISTAMNNEAADFLESLEAGRLFY